MKRFYKEAAAAPVDGGWQVTLDGRAIRTPAKAPLVVPGEAMARAIAGEWAAQGEEIKPGSMPLTGLANATIDRVSAGREAFIDSLAAYGDGDVLAYRAEHPDDLLQRQVAAWNPILDWAERRYGVEFTLVQGIMHKPQPAGTVATLRAALAGLDDFTLTAMQPLVTITGSLVIALALLESAIDAETGWTAAHLDELYQVEKWGEDSLATAARDHRRADFDAAMCFVRLSAS
ncbi:ATP12 family chaperone protein [Sphingoaurantiacus capsulatus]|uniref:ATP12 family chaperone protein n=1 Tax=Sphingoaurantiacus capsulatus TaxID=1771310 RepID=A0ABV7X835_9SPHN